ncbi:MAG: hypothetical protein J6I89_03025, partial [Oscillospiraceae bacterium]|nr:hypothetical protein [Oscillospiraceae bacterium]MBQ7871521.1 hypothetical protein [Oscillospiraceae bacterium]
MKKHWFRAAILLLAVLLTGCILDPAESLFAVPQQPEAYYDLQKAIETAMPTGASYSPPVAGENQQAVQMVDLDGNGDDEAVVYLKTTGSNPLSIYIFNEIGGEYCLVASLDVNGSAFDQVLYAKVDDTPGYEIVLGRSISDQVAKLLCVYTLREDGLNELLRASCTEYLTADLDGDGQQGIFLLRSEADVSYGIAEYYHWQDHQLLREREASTSTAVTAVKRIITGQMCEGVSAVFVAAEYGEGTIVTDIFGMRNEEFCNLTKQDDANTGVQTVREYYVYSGDIDSDGLIELPRLYALRTVEGDERSENRSLIGWYNIQLDGSEVQKCVTFHNYSDGWYLTIPSGWMEDLAVTRSGMLGNALGYCFLWPQNEGDTELFTIAATSSDQAAQLAQESGWTVLVQKGEVTYAVHMGPGAAELGLTEESVWNMFHFIQVAWNTGET